MSRLRFFRIVIAVLIFLKSDFVFSQSNSIRWSASEWELANTAKNVAGITEEEKNAMCYLNLSRLFPVKYAEVEVESYKPYSSSGESYKSSLLTTLRSMTPLTALQWSDKMYVLAKCWAMESGRKGLTGHSRTECVTGYSGENCAYGTYTGQEIIVDLLVDEGITSLGHRKNCLNKEFTTVGISIQPHNSVYKICCVLDFDWNEELLAQNNTYNRSVSPNQVRVESNTVTQNTVTESTSSQNNVLDYSHNNSALKQGSSSALATNSIIKGSRLFKSSSGRKNSQTSKRPSGEIGLLNSSSNRYFLTLEPRINYCFDIADHVTTNKLVQGDFIGAISFSIQSAKAYKNKKRFRTLYSSELYFSQDNTNNQLFLSSFLSRSMPMNYRFYPQLSSSLDFELFNRIDLGFGAFWGMSKSVEKLYNSQVYKLNIAYKFKLVGYRFTLGAEAYQKGLKSFSPSLLVPFLALQFEASH
jgi:uncharacterized protein YkwD